MCLSLYDHTRRAFGICPFYGSDVPAVVVFRYSDGGDSFRFMAKGDPSFRLNMRALTHFIQIESFMNFVFVLPKSVCCDNGFLAQFHFPQSIV